MPKYHYELTQNTTVFEILSEYHYEGSIQNEKEKHNSKAIKIRNTGGERKYYVCTNSNLYPPYFPVLYFFMLSCYT